MKFVVPITVDVSNLTTDVTNEAATWSAGTYNTGDKAVYGEKVFEVTASPSTTDRPDTGAAATVPTWLELGYANIWRMWREGSDSLSTKTDTITTTISPISQTITTVGVLGVTAASVTVTLTDSVAGVVYNETKTVTDIGVSDWWEYFFTLYNSTGRALIFEDIPPYYGAGVSLQIVITAAAPTDVVSVGRVVIGQDIQAGRSLQGVTSRNLTFTQKTRDEFGNLTLVTRRTIRVIDFPVMLDATEADFVQGKASELAATPTLFIADSDRPETIVFGVFEDFQVIINGLSVVECALTVEEY